jgi:photosystem II stability/assembly factor-like uncharacterized protein
MGKGVGFAFVVALSCVANSGCRSRVVEEITPPTPSNLKSVKKNGPGGSGGWTDGKTVFVGINRSSDVGKTWTQGATEISPSSLFLAMWGRAANDVFVAHGATTGVVAFHSRDGNSWSPVRGPSNTTFGYVSGFPDGTTVLLGTRLVGDGSIAIKRPNESEFSDSGTTVLGHPYALCTMGDAIYVVSNASKRGNVVKIGMPLVGTPKRVLEVERELYGIWCGNNQIVAVGGRGLAVRSTDNGQSWVEEQAPSTRDLFSIWGPSGDALWAVGDGGAIVKRTRAGWVAESSPTSQQLQAVWGASSSDVWAAGQSTVLHLE